MTDISIIIVSYNTRDITLACLNSIYEFTAKTKFEIIVVDNNSTDGSVEALLAFEKSHRNFKLIRSTQNFGFGHANNLGAKEASGEYLLFLNSDTLMTSDILPHCLEQMRTNTKLGVYSCNLIGRDGQRQSSGGFFPNLYNLAVWQLFVDDLPILGNMFRSIHPHSFESKPDWVTGAFMLIPKKTFLDAGAFDEKIFMYTEELELCYRIRKLGMSVMLDQKVNIVHLGGASGGSYLAITKEVEGFLYFWQKHFPKQSLAPVKALFFIGSLLRLFIFGIIKANATYRKSYWEILRLLS